MRHCRMRWKYLFLNFFVTLNVMECTFGNNCDLKIESSCYNNQLQQNKSMTISDLSNNECSPSYISDEANYTIFLSENGKFDLGIIKVSFNLPSTTCNYYVALLVNDTIQSQEECEQHMFINNFDEELHTVDKKICVTKQNTIDNKQDSTSTCQNDVRLFFKHVYTGCYALRFSIDGHALVIRARRFVKTQYQRTEVEEPRFHCTYVDRNDVNEGMNLVTFTFSISISSDYLSVILQLHSLLSIYENEENTCNKYSNAPTYTWNIVDGQLNNLELDTSDGNCNLMKVKGANETSTDDIECSFSLPVSYNNSYCISIVLHDERCVRSSIWNPPVKSKSSLPCMWISKCTRIDKVTEVIEYTGELQENKIITGNTILLLPIAIGIISLIAILFVVFIWINRLCTLNNTNPIYSIGSTCDLKVMRNSLETNEINDADENERNNKLLNDSAIVLLYAKGPKLFMRFMADFREALILYCNCHVYDWYAASEWDTVARVSACDWAAQLFKKNYRTVWIDTQIARSLITAQIMNSTSTIDNQSFVDKISDFRDIAFPAVLNLAKRSIVNTKFQYTKHFIVRLEGYDNAYSDEDPFADLSPHARYLVPYHLSQLCSHLSSKRSDSIDESLMAEEIKFRERLMQMKNDL